MRVRTVALALVAVARIADAKPCGDATRIDQLERRGDDTIVCSDKTCWRIDKRGQFADEPTATHPNAQPELLLPEEKTVDYVSLRGPAEIHVKEQTVEVCTDRCRSFTVKPRSKIDDITSVTVLPDKHTVFVGTGVAVVTNERLLRFDLDHLDAGRLIGKCAEVWDAFPGGNVLVQKTDCANAGGPRILFSSAGKILGEVGAQFSMANGEYHLGGDLWLFVDYGTFAVWDVRRAVAVSRLPACH